MEKVDRALRYRVNWIKDGGRCILAMDYIYT